MVMSWIWTGLVGLSIVSALLFGESSALASAALSGAQSGITLTLSMAGGICLWSGVAELLRHCGATSKLAQLLRQPLGMLFPTTKNDPELAGYLSANVCANFLGLGNAATPMGIQAVQCMSRQNSNGIATDEMCRLIVLNTASIQLIPATVAAIRAELGAASPFDILPAVWLTSLCSAGLGICAAVVLGKVWKNG